MIMARPVQGPEQPSGSGALGASLFDAYTSAAESGPALGYLVLYSVFDGQVTREDLEQWFVDLGLDVGLVPPPLRAVDAFERVTGPDGSRVSYLLDDPAADTRYRPRRRASAGRMATLMVRHVRRDARQIVRYIVREVRDENKTRLSYDTRLGQCVFVRDTSGGDEAGAGEMEVFPDKAAIAALPPAEQSRVTSLLFDIHDQYRRRTQYLSGDKLRGLLRTYIEGLDGLKVRPTGGVYFVPRQHADVLAGLRELVSRFGEGSHLVRVPLPDQDEMRDMVIAAFTTKAKDDLDKLARDIVAAQQQPAATDTVQALYARFRDLQAATGEHAQLLSTSLDDTEAALTLVQFQLTGLLTHTTDEDDDSEPATDEHP